MKDVAKPVAVKSEVGYLKLGELEVAVIPGEIYPELVLGKVQTPADPGADFPDAPAEPAIYAQLVKELYPTDEVGTDLRQLYAREDGHRARDGVLLPEDEVVARVRDLPWLDEDGGHWDRAAREEGRVLLAGGLGPENVRAAIEAVQPWCVDASRSLEASPGIKDHDRARAFVEAAR